jgi:hypothetical protein
MFPIRPVGFRASTRWVAGENTPRNGTNREVTEPGFAARSMGTCRIVRVGCGEEEQVATNTEERAMQYIDLMLERITKYPSKELLDRIERALVLFWDQERAN